MTATALYVPGSAGETFGTVLRTRRAGAFVFRESCYPSGLRMPVHYHPRGYLCYVAEGVIHERRTGGVMRYGPGSLHFHPPGDPHAGATPEAALTSVSIIPLGPEARLLETRIAPGAPAAPASSLLAARCQSEMALRDEVSDLALEGLALELVAALVRTRAPRERRAPAWLLAVRDVLHARFREPLRLAELSAAAGIHPVHLVRGFRRHLGVTPAAYQRRLRIESARQALIATDVPIAILALEAGFASQAHFTRVFRQVTGSTPAAWRRAHARGA